MSKEFPVNTCSEINACCDMGRFSRSSHIENSGRRSQIECMINCSFWSYLCSLCLENSPRTIYPYHNQRMQALIPPDFRTMVVFCQWLHSKCIVNTQFVANILFTDEADSQGTVLWPFIIPMYGLMKIPTPPRHQDINIDFPSMSGWAHQVINT
jgi:hypothetical protein